MNEATKQAIFSIIRSILMGVGYFLSIRGYADSETAQATVGAVMVILPVIWGAVDKFLAERKTKAREVVAVNAGIIVADATVGKTPLASQETTPGIIAAAGPAADPASPIQAAEAPA